MNQNTRNPNYTPHSKTNTLAGNAPAPGSKNPGDSSGHNPARSNAPRAERSPEQGLNKKPQEQQHLHDEQNQGARHRSQDDSI